MGKIWTAFARGLIGFLNGFAEIGETFEAAAKELHTSMDGVSAELAVSRAKSLAAATAE